jgi:peptidoglycan biosynthesis protein MviN/MurJ (putative lipid II flippase)
MYIKENKMSCLCFFIKKIIFPFFSFLNGEILHLNNKFCFFFFKSENSNISMIGFHFSRENVVEMTK